MRRDAHGRGLGTTALRRRSGRDLSLSRLNHGLPGCEPHPQVVPGPAQFQHEITDARLPPAEPVLHKATALATAVAMRDPSPPRVERLVRALLLPRALLAAGGSWWA
jgi:hypothetical protein